MKSFYTSLVESRLMHFEVESANYYLNDTSVWNDVREWKRILVDLGLLTDKRPQNINSTVTHYTKLLCNKCDYCQKISLQ